MSLANSYIEIFKAFSNARVLRCLHGLAYVFLLGFFQFVPSSALAGANQWTSIGPDGGPINALAIDPSHPATLYAGTGGGVFQYNQHRRPRGNNWR